MRGSTLAACTASGCAGCDRCLKIVAARTWIIVLVGPVLAMGVIVAVTMLVVSVWR